MTRHISKEDEKWMTLLVWWWHLLKIVMFSRQFIKDEPFSVDIDWIHSQNFDQSEAVIEETVPDWPKVELNLRWYGWKVNFLTTQLYLHLHIYVVYVFVWVCLHIYKSCLLSSSHNWSTWFYCKKQLPKIQWEQILKFKDKLIERMAVLASIYLSLCVCMHASMIV